MFNTLSNPLFACCTAAEIMASLMPIFQSIREHQGNNKMGFLHPITSDRVTLSAHGCETHSWSRKISAPSRLSLPSSSTSSPCSTLPRVLQCSVVVCSSVLCSQGTRSIFNWEIFWFIWRRYLKILQPWFAVISLD